MAVFSFDYSLSGEVVSKAVFSLWEVTVHENRPDKIMGSLGLKTKLG